MDIGGKKVAILVHDYFEQAEFEEPLSALHDAAAEVQVISASGSKQLQALQHADKGDTFTADLLLEEASDTDYDSLVLPGGAMNADALRMVDEARRWATDFLDQGKPLAVICHAPWLLASAGLADGRRLTSYHTIQDDMRNAGADWVDEPVVIDGTLITSRKPDDLPKFNDALITMLGGTAGPDSEQQVEDDARLESMGYDKQRDQISAEDEREMLLDEDESDPDQLRPSRAVSGDERDGTE